MFRRKIVEKIEIPSQEFPLAHNGLHVVVVVAELIVSRENLPHHNLKWLQQVPRRRVVPSGGGNSSVNFLGWAQVRGPDSEIDPESVITESAERNRIQIFKNRDKKNGIP